MLEPIYLNNNWYFFQEWNETLSGTAGEKGELVRLPHTIRPILLHPLSPKAGEALCCYQKKIPVPESWRGYSLLLTFEGVAYSYKVFVNGYQVLECPNGFSSHTVDISEEVSYGNENLICVQVDSRRESVLKYLGDEWNERLMGGIFRDVFLNVKHPVHMADVFYQPSLLEAPKTRGMSLDRLKSVQMPSNVVSDITLSAEGKKRLLQRRLVVCQFLEEKQIANQPITESGRITTLSGKVSLWDIASPALYTIRTELRLDGETVDAHTAKIGFRHIRWTKKGFFLNGRRLSIRGLCRRQIYPYVGYAMPSALQEEDARIIKQELFLNAVRTSHSPPSRHFLDACDRLGILVFPEVPGLGKLDEALAMEYLPKAAQNMIIDGRNHPSIVLWGLRLSRFYKPVLCERVLDTAKALDPTRLVGGARSESRSAVPEDIYTFEDYTYDGKNSALLSKKEASSKPSKPYLIWAFGGAKFSSSPFENEEKAVSQLLYHAKVLDSISDKAEYLGSFGDGFCDYPAFDSYGDVDGLSCEGVLDIFRNPKMAAYLYAANPVHGDLLYVSGDFFAPGNLPIKGSEQYIISNADSVKMYRGEDLIYEYKKNDSPFRHMRHGPIPIKDFIGDRLKNEGYMSSGSQQMKRKLNLIKRKGKRTGLGSFVPFLHAIRALPVDEAGIEAMYRRYIADPDEKNPYRFEAILDGRVVSRIVIARSSVLQIAASCSHSLLREVTGYDVAAVRIRIVDEYGQVQTKYNESIRVEAAGCIAVVGPAYVPLFAGMCAVYVKSLGQAGKGALRIHVQGMPSLSLGFGVLLGKPKEKTSPADIFEKTTDLGP